MMLQNTETGNPKPKTKNPVTLILGIICKNGIVIAADSRTTRDDGTIVDTTEKVHLIQMVKRRALIGRAGHDHLSSRVIYTLESKARGFDPVDYRSIAELANSAVDESRDVIRGLASTQDELQKRFTEYPMAFLVGYYYKRQPFLFKLDFLLGLSSPIKSGHISIGCAAPLADFILRDVDTSEMNPEQAIVLATYVVEEIKQSDGRCGGPVRVGLSSWYQNTLETSCFGHPVPPRTVNAILNYSKTVRRNWVQGLQAVIDQIPDAPKD